MDDRNTIILYAFRKFRFQVSIDLKFGVKLNYYLCVQFRMIDFSSSITEFFRNY